MTLGVVCVPISLPRGPPADNVGYVGDGIIVGAECIAKAGSFATVVSLRIGAASLLASLYLLPSRMVPLHILFLFEVESHRAPVASKRTA